MFSLTLENKEIFTLSQIYSILRRHILINIKLSQSFIFIITDIHINIYCVNI